MQRKPAHYRQSFFTGLAGILMEMELNILKKIVLKY